MKTRITAILLICVILSISVQATTRGKITSIADPDRFTKSEIAQSNIALKNILDRADVIATQTMAKTITPAKANAFFCDNKELISKCGDFLKTDSGGISVRYDGAEETDRYSYFKVKRIVIMGYGQSSFSPISPPEGHEVIEQLCEKLLKEQLIEKDNYLIVGYYPAEKLTCFEISFSYSRRSGDSLIISNKPRSEEWEKENRWRQVYRDFYMSYLYSAGDLQWGG